MVNFQAWSKNKQVFKFLKSTRNLPDSSLIFIIFDYHSIHTLENTKIKINKKVSKYLRVCSRSSTWTLGAPEPFLTLEQSWGWLLLQVELMDAFQEAPLKVYINLEWRIHYYYFIKLWLKQYTQEQCQMHTSLQTNCWVKEFQCSKLFLK